MWLTQATGYGLRRFGYKHRINMAETISTVILVTKEEVFDETGMIRTEIIPSSVTGTQITVSPTPPSNPQVNDIWIDSSE